jgi:hypothetical protein
MRSSDELTPADIEKIVAFNDYQRARSVLAYNLGFWRPGQDFFIKYGRKRCTDHEERYPDFPAALTKITGGKYDDAR